MSRIWYILANALGSKAHNDDSISDKVAAVRLVIVLLYMITNGFIVAGVIRHW